VVGGGRCPLLVVGQPLILGGRDLLASCHAPPREEKRRDGAEGSVSSVGGRAESCLLSETGQSRQGGEERDTPAAEP
jgi:hypothetical protein